MCGRRLLGCLAAAIAVLAVLLCAGLAAAYVTIGPAFACGHADGVLVPGRLSARNLVSGGRERCYLVYLPAGLVANRPAPVVVSLHGFASNATSQARVAGWNRLADGEGFIAVYPEGASFPQRWNAADLFGQQTVDDVQFLRDLLADLGQVVTIDPSRVYVTGMSNGGSMANRVGCEAADTVAAIGTVAAVPVEVPEGCNPVRPVPVIAFHGTADPVVLYGGRTGQAAVLGHWTKGGPVSFSHPPVVEWVMGWVERNGCDPAAESLPGSGDARGRRYTGCRDDVEVVLYTISGGGHTWPGGMTVPFMGRTSRDVDASATMWAFFEEHPLPASP